MFTMRSMRSSRSLSLFAVPAILTGLLAAGLVVLGGAVASGSAHAPCDAGAAAWNINDDGDTILIGTAAELILLSTTDDPGFYWSEGWTYRLTADIDLNSCDWSPIGTSDSPLVGTFDGDGHKISGLYISSTSAGDVGLFGFVGDGSYIQELTVSGEINIPLGSDAGGSTVGGIAGYIAGETYLNKVRADVDISVLTAAGSGNIGGLVGHIDYGLVRNSAHRGDFVVTGTKIVGGLVGYSTDSLELNSNYSIATFDVTGLDAFDSAGIIGDGCDGVPSVIDTFSVGSGQHWGVQRADCGTYEDTFYNKTTFLGVPTNDEDSLVGVLAETTLNMKDRITYEQNNWNIVEGWAVFEQYNAPLRIWGICSLVNDGYPFLLWEYTTDPCNVTPPPSNSGSSGSVYVAPVIVQEVVMSRTLRKSTIIQATGNNPARLVGRSLGKDVIFAADSVRLSELTKKTLRQAARLAISSKSDVAVTGFAALSSSGRAYEKSVAQRRALAVARYLRAQGLEATIYYYGLSGRAGLAFEGEPRRVEIRILK
jgi:hypothetical protein